MTADGGVANKRSREPADLSVQVTGVAAIRQRGYNTGRSKCVLNHGRTLLKLNGTSRLVAGVVWLALVVAAGCGDDAEPVGDDAAVSADAGTDDVSDGTAADGDGGGSDDDVAPDSDAGAPDPDGGDGGGGDTADAADIEGDGSGAPPLVVSCDGLDPAVCHYPWPSSLYLAADATRPTGYRLELGDSMPANRQGRRIDPALVRHLDGFSLGSPIMTVIPGVDLDGFATEDDIGPSMEADSPSMLFEVTDEGLERVPHWVELDGTAREGEEATLYMRSAVFLRPDTQYIVAYGRVTDAEGAPITSSPAFAALRDGTDSDDVSVQLRREAFDGIFALLQDAGVERESLYLAWDFHTGSLESIQRRVRQATELVLDEVGDEGAPLVFDEVRRYVRVADESGLPTDTELGMSIDATMTTPSVGRLFPGEPGLVLELDEGGDVALADPLEVDVQITVPHRAVEGEPVGVIVYGHGMLGSAEEIYAGHLQRITEELGYIMVSTPMRGMSADDNLGVLGIMFDLNNFNVIGDGLVQGVAQTHVLARTSVTRLPAMLAELDADITVDPDRLYWFGGSQGGIFGPTIVASSPDIARGGLAVPGNNYSTLLSRSVNFDPFFERLNQNYSSSHDVNLCVAFAQLWWDHTDPISWWQTLLTEQTPDGRDRDVLLLLSKADKQVAVVTNEILSRTFPEVALMAPYDVERTPWGITQTTYPHTGSGTVLFDFGNPWPTGRANLPPNDALPDPHPRIAEVNAAGALLQAFYDDGEIIDVCGGDGCRPD